MTTQFFWHGESFQFVFCKRLPGRVCCLFFWMGNMKINQWIWVDHFFSNDGFMAIWVDLTVARDILWSTMGSQVSQAHDSQFIAISSGTLWTSGFAGIYPFVSNFGGWHRIFLGWTLVFLTMLCLKMPLCDEEDDIWPLDAMGFEVWHGRKMFFFQALPSRLARVVYLL